MIQRIGCISPPRKGVGECRKEREENEVVSLWSWKEQAIHSSVIKITMGGSNLSKKFKNLWFFIDANLICLKCYFPHNVSEQTCPCETIALSAPEAINIIKNTGFAERAFKLHRDLPRTVNLKGHLYKEFHLPSLNHFVFFPGRHCLPMN